MSESIKEKKKQEPAKILTSYRLSETTINQLNELAKNKKAGKTKVLSDLISLAYLSVFSAKGKQAKEIIKSIDNDVFNKL